MEIKKKLLITGATSYIGKHLIKKLLSLGTYEITALVRKSSNFEILTNESRYIDFHIFESNYESIQSLFKKKKIDCVYHLASLTTLFHSESQISTMIDSNIKLGTFLLEAAKNYGCKNFINTGTYWQNYEVINRPNSFYAATKSSFEIILDYYCFAYNLSSITLKLCDVYGYDDHRNKLVSNLINDEVCLDHYDLTKGDQKIYFVYIDDVISAFIKALTLLEASEEYYKKHLVFGVFANQKHSLKEFVNILEKEKGKKFKIKWGKKKYNEFQIMNPIIEEKLINWEAKVPLKKGIQLILNKA